MSSIISHQPNFAESNTESTELGRRLAIGLTGLLQHLLGTHFGESSQESEKTVTSVCTRKGGGILTYGQVQTLER